MGSYVLYLLMLAFVALIFAYFSGTLVFRERKLYMLLVSVGFYLLMGSSLMEVWGDKMTWSEWAIGLNAALVAIGVASIGTGALFREAQHMEDPQRIEILAKVFIGISVAMGAILAASGGTSHTIVGPEGVSGATISGSFSYLGPAGWVLGAPLMVGAVLMSWIGARAAMTRKDARGFWLMGAGVLLLLWPFDVWFNDLPLSPAFMMMAITMTYFGFQLPKEGEGIEEDEHSRDDAMNDPSQDNGPAPWVKEAITAHKADIDDVGPSGDSDDGVGIGDEAIGPDDPEEG